jgi:hypothetical protein
MCSTQHSLRGYVHFIWHGTTSPSALWSNSDEWNVTSVFVEYIPLWYIKAKLTYVNHNQVVLVSSIYAACFGRADRPLALKYITLKQKMKCVYIYSHLVACLKTGPKPLPKRALQVVRSRGSSFK